MSSQNPDFSLDGKYLIFKHPFEGYNAFDSEIIKIKADGSDEKILYQ